MTAHLLVHHKCYILIYQYIAYDKVVVYEKMGEERVTSIRVYKTTKKRFDGFKIIPDETHDNELNRLLDELEKRRKEVSVNA